MGTLRKQRNYLLHRQVIVGFLAIGIGIVKTSGFSDYDDLYRGNNCVTHKAQQNWKISVKYYQNDYGNFDDYNKTINRDYND